MQDPLSLHKYLYANASPVDHSDPTGLTTLGEIGSVFKTISQLAVQHLPTLSKAFMRVKYTMGGTAVGGVLFTILANLPGGEEITPTEGMLAGFQLGIAFDMQLTLQAALSEKYDTTMLALLPSKNLI